jgi:hypothetical protein
MRAVCDEDKDRFCHERLEEFFAVECGDVGFQFEGIVRPDFPPWMFDAVLPGAFAPPSRSSYGVTSTRGVAPVMFGDEFFVRTNRERLRFAELQIAARGRLPRSLSGSADPVSQGAGATPIWSSLLYQAGTRRIPVRVPT